MRISAVAVVLTMLGSFACTGGKSGEHAEAGSDVGTEAGSDIGSDVRAEVGPEVGSEVGTDVGREAGSDAAPDGGSDASPLPIGANYPCGAGDGGLDGDGGTSCVVGQTYCYVMLPRPLTTGTPAYACKTYSDLTAACAVNPTCECLCAHGYHCQTECRCSESAGFATVSCEPV